MALGGSPVEVYFDDFNVEHTKSPVVQSDEYYPFGLTFNSYNRENSLLNMYQYNGKEKLDVLDLNWLDYGARIYMGDIGRWAVADAKADKFVTVSPYSYAINNPVILVDPDGKEVKPTNEAALNAILNSLTAEDRAYIKLTKSGMIDRELINKRQSESGNFNSLKNLVNVDQRYDVTVGTKFKMLDANGKKIKVVMEPIQYADPGDILYDPRMNIDNDGSYGYNGQTLVLKSHGGDERSTTENYEIIIKYL